MGAGPSSVMGPEGYGRAWEQTSLGDMPESCVAAVLLFLDPPEICHVARLNRAFRGAASADCVWAAKLPANYRYLVALAAAADDDRCCDGAAEGNIRCCSSAAIKKEIYARLCRPTPFDGGTKDSKNVVCMLMSALESKKRRVVCVGVLDSKEQRRPLPVHFRKGYDDHRYRGPEVLEPSAHRRIKVPTPLCPPIFLLRFVFHNVAYLQQIWWLEVAGEIDFCFPAGLYSLFFRLHLDQTELLLIDATTATWHRQRLEELFTARDIEVILQIPLSTRRQEDFWSWHYEKNGVFSMRSAYRMLVNNREHATAYMENIPGRSDIASEEKEWLRLWKLDLPSKIKIFLWRLARLSLPSADVLHRRNMTTHSSCSLCGAQDSWKHALLECNLARCVWALEDEEVTERNACIEEVEARVWWSVLAKTLSGSVLTRVAVTLWAIWYARRKAIHEESFQSPLSTHCFIDRYMADLGLVEPDKKIAGQPKQHAPKWIPPSVGRMKINVDAAISKNSGKAVASVVARDAVGRFLGASALVLDGARNPETVEAIACREGLALASDFAIERFRLACDNINVIRSIRGEGKGLYGHVVLEIQARAQGFESVDFVHEGRNSNGDAHSLARSSIYYDVGRLVWHGSSATAQSDCFRASARDLRGRAD
ncbi:hypothetical protein PR202_ga19322 [Eleusine coracana subsp. coracana]|uniref:Uncharacterized protein n=1 Tax=Eleusine coracana subsp. coracana TaxID=191504 RepID=A0AAV5CV23_ELECO|nr:hypothetical protein PR202_ga19322 [Eleusine coracana subsp. coracana]